MTRIRTANRATALLLAPAIVCATALFGCGRPETKYSQGYVEGEFVYVASPMAGALESLKVQRGAQVKAGDLLFVLEAEPERSVRDEAERRLAQARATLEDVKKGRRPTEIDSIEAQLKQARASVAFSESTMTREEKLHQAHVAAIEELDRARSSRDQDRERVAQLEADLRTARLGSRVDQIAAAEANVRALDAALGKAEWDLAQKRQHAHEAGVVFDTLYREGEWVGAGRPVVALLPPRNVKVRAFVPQTQLSSIHYGDPVQVRVDGASEPFLGKISYLSPRAEFTPPVVYTREARSKFVIMIEAVFDPEAAAKLHPGQPVDVHFGR